MRTLVFLCLPPLARWAVGVLIYEMGSGRSPFEARAQLDMFKKISRREFQFPTFFSEGLKEVIDGLLQVDLTQRLGSTYVPACAKTHDARRACGPCTHARHARCVRWGAQCIGRGKRCPAIAQKHARVVVKSSREAQSSHTHHRARPRAPAPPSPPVSRHGGVEVIKAMGWFHGIPWADYANASILRSRDNMASYIPATSGPDDVSQFDNYPEEPITWFVAPPLVHIVTAVQCLAVVPLGAAQCSGSPHTSCVAKARRFGAAQCSGSPRTSCAAWPRHAASVLLSAPGHHTLAAWPRHAASRYQWHSQCTRRTRQLWRSCHSEVDRLKPRLTLFGDSWWQA